MRLKISSLAWERSYPYALSLGLTVLIAVWAEFSFPLSEALQGASLTVGSILAGFAATIKSIVIGMDSPRIKQIRGTSYGGLFLDYVFSSIVSALIFCGISFAGFFNLTAQWFYLPIWSFCCILMLLTFWRLISVFKVLVKKDFSMVE